MSTSLADRLRARATFNEEAVMVSSKELYSDPLDKEWDYRMTMARLGGARWQSERNAEIIAALIECVEALAAHSMSHSTTCSSDDCYKYCPRRRQDEALAKLAALVGEK